VAGLRVGAALAVAAAEAGAQGTRAPAAGPTVSLDVSGAPLSVGDVVVVNVLLEDDLTGSYKIGSEGTINLMYIGRIMAAGLTTDQLAEDITNQLRRYIKRPVVQVTIDAEASVRRLYVSGQVAEPGAVTVPFGGTVAGAVLAAGVTPQSDLSGVRLTRMGEQTTILDLSGIRDGEQMGQPLLARDGDLVHVPKLRGMEFSVYGLVAEPGVKPLDPAEADDLDVMRALSAAGGHLEGANLAEALLVHQGGQTEKVDLSALLLQGDASQNKKMRPGDALILRAADRITVAGEVTEPTSFLAPQPVKVLEAVARAKGVTALADLKGAQVLRAEGPLTVDLEALLWRGDLSQNVLVRPGESLIVPTREADQVLVVGAVTQPTAMDVYRARDRSIVRLVQTALPKPTADLRRVVVNRVGAPAPIVVDVKSIMEEGNLQANMDAMPGDMIFVPERKKVYAIGAFTQPAVYALGDDMTLVELVGMAGSFRQDALPSKMRLLRPSPGGTQVTNIDFRRIEQGQAGGDMPLQEGDIVYVPSRSTQRTGWDAWRDILWAGVGLLNIFRY